MKKLVVAGLAIALVLVCAGVYTATVSAAGPKDVVRHVVLFKFKDGTPPEKVKEIEQKFAALKGQLDVIKDFEWGINSSPEKINDGFTHCFFVTFADEAGRDAYLPSKPHKDFVAVLGPHLEKALVVDYKPQP